MCLNQSEGYRMRIYLHAFGSERRVFEVCILLKDKDETLCGRNNIVKHHVSRGTLERVSCRRCREKALAALHGRAN